MPTRFLEVPLKMTCRYDLGSVVHARIVDIYGAEFAFRMKMPCRALGELRNAAAVPVLMDISGHRGVSAAASIAACKYINALHYIAKAEAKILPGDYAQDTVKFRWRDAFSTEIVETPQYRIEAMAFAYNFAGYCCTLGIRNTRSALINSNEFSTGASLFLDAAGVFDYMPRMPYLVNGGSIDLHAPAHVALKFAMLANAQQLYYLQAKFSGSLSLDICAKLAAGTQRLYSITESHLNSAELRDTSINGALLVPAMILSKYFDAETALCDAARCQLKGREGDSESFGKMVAHHRKAMNAIQEALNLTGSLHSESNDPVELTPVVKEKYEDCRIQLLEAESRNDTMYQMPVPSRVTSSEPKIMAQPTEMDFMFSGDPVDTILPLSMSGM